MDFAVDSMEAFDRLFIAVVPAQSQYEIFTVRSCARCEPAHAWKCLLFDRL